MIVLHTVDASSLPGAPDFMFFCPGCKCEHGVWTTKRNGVGATWTFNGNMDKPTFNPSLLIRTTRFTSKGQADYDAWAAAGFPEFPARQRLDFESAPSVCHSFVRDGMIQFLGDCTHELRGKTVSLEPF